jgi:hypothetical protein
MATMTVPAFAWHPKAEIHKQVKDVTTSSSWKDASDASHALVVNPGDTVEYKVTVGDDTQWNMAGTNVTDSFDKSGVEVKSSENASRSLGTVQGHGTKHYTYKGTVTSQQNGRVVCNSATVKGHDDHGEGNHTKATDTACVKVHVTPKPVYTCDNLNVTKSGDNDRTVKVSVDATAKHGATLQKVVYDFGNGKTKTVDVTGNNKTAGTTYTYTKAGDHNVSATLYFSVNGETKKVSATDNQCVGTVSFAAPTQTPPKQQPPKQETPAPKPAPTPEKPQPKQPKVLPNTGPGAVLALSAGSSILGYAAYILNLKRRALNR